MFLAKYYTFFDLSGYQSEQTDKLRIGAGLRNKNANILAKQYLPNGQGQDNVNPNDQSIGFCDVEYNADEAGQLPTDEQGGSKQITTIIIFVASFVLILALGAIIYCKCKKAPDVNDSTPIGEN